MAETSSTVELSKREKCTLYQGEIMRNLCRIRDYVLGKTALTKEHRFSIHADSEDENPLFVFISEPTKLRPTVYRISTPEEHLGEFHEFGTGTTDNPLIQLKKPGEILPLTENEQLDMLQRIYNELKIRSGDVRIRSYSDKFQTPVKDTNLLIKVKQI